MIRRSKHNNVKVEVEGVGRFDSKGEHRRWGELELLLKAGKITDLDRQVRFQLHANGKKIGAYVADFVYQMDGKAVVEDFKGFRTSLYRWKKKHFEAEYGFPITEVTCRTPSASGKSPKRAKSTS